MENKVVIKIKPSFDFSDTIKQLLEIQFPDADFSEGVYIVPIKSLPFTIISKYIIK